MSINKSSNQVVAITGGKGGIGKTALAVNLAIAMQLAGQRALLVDADLELGNVDILLGLKAKKNLYHLLQGECSCAELLIEGPAGVNILPAPSGYKQMANLSVAEIQGIINAISEIPEIPNQIIIDTAAGIDDAVVSILCNADEIILVLCNEPTSITDAYALIKILHKHHKFSKFRIVLNKIRTEQEAEELFNRILQVTDQYLNVSLSLSGAIPYDIYMEKAIKKQKPVILEYPNCKSAMALKSLAKKICQWPFKGQKNFAKPLSLAGVEISSYDT